MGPSGASSSAKHGTALLAREPFTIPHNPTSVPTRHRLPDTCGYGVPLEYFSFPLSVAFVHTHTSCSQLYAIKRSTPACWMSPRHQRLHRGCRPVSRGWFYASSVSHYFMVLQASCPHKKIVRKSQFATYCIYC